MTDGMAYWLDHKGALMGPASADDPTGWEKYAQVTHRIMKPQPGQLIQAISWCGHRVHEVPGHGPVDCAECLALLAEDAEPVTVHEQAREAVRTMWNAAFGHDP